MLHDYDPTTKEEEEEVQNYLKSLGEATLVVHSMPDDCEEEDMSLWDLLCFCLYYKQAFHSFTTSQTSFQ